MCYDRIRLDLVDKVINPEEPWSFAHIMNTIALVTLLYGAGKLAGGKKSGKGDGKSGLLDEGEKALFESNSKVIANMNKRQLNANLPEGWTYSEHNGRVHIKDTNGNFRVRIDPPDKATGYQHMHIYNEFGNPLDINGNIVEPKSPDGHIPWGN